jgi:hypothetical protein
MTGKSQFAYDFDNNPRPAPQHTLLARAIRPEAKALFRVWHVCGWRGIWRDDVGRSGVSGLWRAEKSHQFTV